jgi:hypothetical protein
MNGAMHPAGAGVVADAFERRLPGGAEGEQVGNDPPLL